MLGSMDGTAALNNVIDLDFDRDVVTKKVTTWPPQRLSCRGPFEFLPCRIWMSWGAAGRSSRHIDLPEPVSHVLHAAWPTHVDLTAGGQPAVSTPRQARDP